MYGVGKDFKYVVPGQPCDPIGPDLKIRDEWWFRGPAYRALPPPKGQVTQLLAGGPVTFELSCHVAWTSFGWSTTQPGSHLDACPGNTGAYHSGDLSNDFIDEKLLSGCALGIADVDDIEKVTPDNLVIFSVQSQCVKQKVTSFEVPAAMPPCTGKKCICGWFGLANTGAVNFYMTAFDCTVTNPSPTSILPIKVPLLDPYLCENWPHNQTCLDEQQRYPKRPIYAYNEPQNVVWVSNEDRAGYHEKWGWVDGAQNGIFGEEKTVGTMASERGKGVVVKAVGETTTTMAAAKTLTTTTIGKDHTEGDNYDSSPASQGAPTPPYSQVKHVKCKEKKPKDIAAVSKLTSKKMETKPEPRPKPKPKTTQQNQKKQQHRQTEKSKPKTSSRTPGRRYSRKDSRAKLRMTCV